MTRIISFWDYAEPESLIFYWPAEKKIKENILHWNACVVFTWGNNTQTPDFGSLHHRVGV